MDIYELIREIKASKENYHLDCFPQSFHKLNRDKLENSFDLKVFDLFEKAYKIDIIYRHNEIDNGRNIEYIKYGAEEVTPFTDDELEVFKHLDWEKLPKNLKAHIHDVIWLCNKKYEAAAVAAEEYYASYIEWFDEEYWPTCVDYINRAIQLAAKIGDKVKEEEFLDSVYNDVVRLNGNDSSFLSIKLLELLVMRNYNYDFDTMILLTEKLICKNKGSISTSKELEQAYHIKAEIHKKQNGQASENKVYIEYADYLMQEANKPVEEASDKSSNDNRDWFIAEENIKRAIELFGNHGASEKDKNAQRYLVEFQREKIKYMKMHTFKFDASGLYKKFSDAYEGHSVEELIWDVVFAFEFQSKEAIRNDIEKNPSISDLFPLQTMDSDGQTESSLPPRDLKDENNILLHMYNKAKQYESIQGKTIGRWFINYFIKKDLQETDLDMIFKNNPIIPNGQEKDIQRGVYLGLIGHMSDSLDKLAPKAENLIRNLAEMCGDLMTYYNTNEGVQQKKVLSKVFLGENLNECVDENIIFTFDGLMQQKAGSNIRNRIGHGLNLEKEYYTGDCIYFVMIVLKFCAMFCRGYLDEKNKRINAYIENKKTNI